MTASEDKATRGEEPASLAELLDAHAREPELELPICARSAALGLRELEGSSDLEPVARRARVVEVVRREPVLAAVVLRQANSSTFAGLAALWRLEPAIARLGDDTVESGVGALLSGAVLPNGNDPLSDALERAWRHALAVARTAHAIAGGRVYTGDCESPASSAEDAYLTGLMSNLGVPFLVSALRSDRGPLARLQLGAGARNEILSDLQRGYGCRLLRNWGLPPRALAALGEQTPVDLEDRQAWRIVNMAAALVGRAGLSLSGQAHEDALWDLAEPLGLGDVAVAALLVRTEDLLGESQQ